MRLFITGGSRGIGHAILGALSADCDAATILGQSESGLNAVQEEFRSAIAEVSCIAADLADLGDVESKVAAWAQGETRLDTLVLCAGLYSDGALTSMPFELFEHDLRVNLTSSYVIIQGLVDLLKQSDRPRIVIVGSTAAYEPYQIVPSYGVAKWGLRGLSINLREELRGDRIGVSFISPGGTLTDMWAGEDLPAGRLLSPDDIAALVKASLSLSSQAVVEELIVRPIEGDIHE